MKSLSSGTEPKLCRIYLFFILNEGDDKWEIAYFSLMISCHISHDGKDMSDGRIFHHQQTSCHTDCGFWIGNQEDRQNMCCEGSNNDDKRATRTKT